MSELILHQTAKLGKTRALYHKKDLLMVEFLQKGVPLKQASVGFGVDHEHLIKDWGMLGNDSAGDCVWAGGDHETMLLNKLAGRDVSFTRETAFADYSAVTGFDPVTGANDNGSDMHDAMDYRRHIGLVDANGKRHKIGGYVALEPGNWGQMLEALAIFDAVAIGFEFPASAMDQFNRGKPWSVVAGSMIEGGHYVPVVARPHRLMLDVITWGRAQGMTSGFFKKYCDEAYGFWTPESLDTHGKSPEGFNITDFKNALASL